MKRLELNKIIDQLSHYSVVDYANTQVKYLSHGQEEENRSFIDTDNIKS